MKLDYYKEQYYSFTGLASNAARQLSLAGIALIWIFKTQAEDGSYQLPNELLFPLIGLIISLGFDLLQYVSGSIIWGGFHRYKEKQRVSKNDDRDDIEAPYYFTWPMNIFFYAKLVAVLVSYVFLLKFAICSITFK